MKNDILELEITDITPEGFGVGRSDGKVYFVADTAVGDVAKCLVLKELKSHAFAKLLELVKPSKARTEPQCPVAKKCGGCSLQHILYSAEAELKQNFVKQSFARIGNMDILVNPTEIGAESKYRNKVQYPFGKGENGECVFGYYAKRSHRIIPHEQCLLQDNVFTQIGACCAEIANKSFLKPYDEATGKGVLRHIVMRKNRKGDILVCLVVTENHKKLLPLAEKLKAKFDCITGIHININKRRDNVIFGTETICLLGDKVLQDTLCGKTFNISPTAFYQVNAEMAQRLYQKGKSLVSDKKGKVILDLYCGAGTIGICIANAEDKLCGVEIIESAVINAKENAIINGRSEENTLFVCGDAAIGVAECKKRFGDPYTIIVDPPRKGLDKEVIQTVAEASPKEILYISCDHATLARDCAIFKEYGYTTCEATPFDLFPRTGHVETIVCLRKQ